MKEIKAIANYGVLAHEKEIVYTFGGSHSHADFSEEIILVIPDEFVISKNYLGKYLVDVPTGETFPLCTILVSENGAPTIWWYSGNRYHKTRLKSREV